MSRAITAGLVFSCLVWLCGCGSAVRQDHRRLKKKCDVTAGQTVSETEARCIARLFGVEDRRGCPATVDRPEGFDRPVYRVIESCNGLGVIVAESGGVVIALVRDDEVLFE